MSTTFDVRAEYIGDGTLDEYTFDFLITSLDQLIVGVVDADLEKVFEVRGTDTTYLEEVDFDSIEGGGTVTLPANLTNGYKIYILLAEDAPTQPSEFREKSDFTLKRIENALDVLSRQIQHVLYLATRSFKLDNGFPDSEDFDTTVPIMTTDQGDQDTANRVVAVNEDGDGLQLGPSLTDLAQQAADAIQAAADAQAAAADAANSEAAADASAADAAASAAAAAAAAGNIKDLAVAMGNTPNAVGMSVETGGILTPQPADSTNPGFVSTTSQVFAGVKTFLNVKRSSAVTGITAQAGGGQALATLLTGEFNEVTTVATNDDSVILTSAVSGLQITVSNLSSKNLMIYPQSGEVFRGRQIDAPYRLSPDQLSVTFTSCQNGVWVPLGINKVVLGSIASPISVDPATGFTNAAGTMDGYADEQIVIFTKNNTGTDTTATPIQTPVKVGQKITLLNFDSNADNRSLRLGSHAGYTINGYWDSWDVDAALENTIDFVSIGSDGTGAVWRERSRLI